MADHYSHHHHQHRPNRLSVPSRAAISSTQPLSSTAATSKPIYSSPYPSSYAALTPTPTPSKQRRLFYSSISNNKSSSSLSFLFLLLFSLRSLYSLFPFLRSSPSSFSLFPFSFLVSLLSFLLTLVFSVVFPSNSSKIDHFQLKPNPNQPIFSLSLITKSQHKLFLSKSVLLAVVFLLRFQALRYCGTSAMILAELSGNVAARFCSGGGDRKGGNKMFKIRGPICLLIGLLLLSISWDRIDCFPLSGLNVVFLRENCVRFWPMLLPFMSGFLGCYERLSMNWGMIRQLGQKRIRLISLFFTTVLLFIPALISIIVFESKGDSISIGNLGWPLANTVVFGVLWSENFRDEKVASSKDFQREFFVTFVCTIVLELFYFPELSLWGLLFCGIFLWIAVMELDHVPLGYVEPGLDLSESYVSSIMKPIRHILSERKSRKIALFLLINTAYMVVEFVAGFMSNSLGLISDACHMLFDCAALAIGLYASYISRLPANNQFNYGRGRFEVLSGYVNAVFLVLVGVLIVLESFERILDPQEISTNSLLSVSIGGLVVNIVGLIFFHEEHHHAHGGSSACTHSHSKSNSHSHVVHEHKPQLQHHDCSHHDHAHQQHGHHDHSHQQHEHHDHSHHQHDHHDHSHQHNDHHDHSHHQHDHHDHSHHQHDHHDHSHQQHDHHDHSHQQHDHHDHSHQQHDHHDHSHQQHDHHDHSHQQHDHHDHSHHQPDHHDHSHQQHDHHDHSHHQHDHHDQSHHHHDHHKHAQHHHQHDSHNLHEHQNKVVSHQIELSSHQRSLDEPKKHPHNHHHIDHNMEGIFLHVLADTMGSVGVVISTLLIKYKGWLAADPACSIFISVLIVCSVIPLLRNSAEILLQRVPKAHEQEMNEAIDAVMKMKGVIRVQNVHIWSFTNTDVVGTLHLQISEDTDKASMQTSVSNMLHDAGIKDLTLQIERIKSS